MSDNDKRSTSVANSCLAYETGEQSRERVDPTVPLYRGQALGTQAERADNLLL